MPEIFVQHPWLLFYMLFGVMVLYIYVLINRRWQIHQLVNDSDGDVKERAEKISEIMEKMGYDTVIIGNKVKGEREKPKFSLLLFIALCLLWVVPGILYAVHKAFQSNTKKKYTLKTA